MPRERPNKSRSRALCSSSAIRASSDAMPSWRRWCANSASERLSSAWAALFAARSEEHTSELQSLRHLVCRLLLEKKKKKKHNIYKETSLTKRIQSERHIH